jgi:hypothetical protein
VKKYISFLIALTFVLPNMVTGGTSIFGFGPHMIGSYRSPYSTSALGRGGYELSFVDSLCINQMNYALWTRLENTSISLNFNYTGTSTKSDQSDIYSTDAGFTGGYITLPLWKQKLVLGMGLTPRCINDIGIKVLGVGPDSNATQKLFSKGNLSEAVMVGSYSPVPKISLALEVGYDFGMIKDEMSLLYNNSIYSDIFVYDEYQMQGVNFGVNGFYTISEKFDLGFKYKSPTQISVHQERKSSNLSGSIKQTRDVNLPALFALGLSYKMSPLWQTGIDCIYQDWEGSYTVDGSKVMNINDSYRIGLGFEKSPVEKRFMPYLQSLSWRGGLFFSQLNVTVQDNPVYEYGISAGLSLPIRRHRNRVDLAFEFGQRGDAKSNILHEQFIGISVSVLSSERWFVREKR